MVISLNLPLSFLNVARRANQLPENGEEDNIVAPPIQAYGDDHYIHPPLTGGSWRKTEEKHKLCECAPTYVSSFYSAKPPIDRLLPAKGSKYSDDEKAEIASEVIPNLWALLGDLPVD